MLCTIGPFLVSTGLFALWCINFMSRWVKLRKNESMVVNKSAKRVDARGGLRSCSEIVWGWEGIWRGICLAAQVLWCSPVRISEMVKTLATWFFEMGYSERTQCLQLTTRHLCSIEWLNKLSSRVQCGALYSPSHYILRALTAVLRGLPNLRGNDLLREKTDNRVIAKVTKGECTFQNLLCDGVCHTTEV